MKRIALALLIAGAAACASAPPADPPPLPVDLVTALGGPTVDPRPEMEP